MRATSSKNILSRHAILNQTYSLTGVQTLSRCNTIFRSSPLGGSYDELVPLNYAIHQVQLSALSPPNVVYTQSNLGHRGSLGVGNEEPKYSLDFPPPSASLF